MKNAILLSQFDVAEVQLIYKSKLPASQRKKITCSRDAYDLLLKNWNPDTVEHCEEFKILLLNRSNAVLGIIAVSKGGISGTVTDVRIIFQAALKANASGEVRDRYDELSRVFNPTNSKEPNEMMNTINAEYDMLMIVFRDAMLAEAAKEKLTVSEKIKELQEKIDPSGLHLEICGTWLWVTGKTYQVKDALKDLGFRYSANKLSWYYRQEDDRSPNQEPIPLEMIREKYGTSVVAL
jgi:hypothetical protein